MSLETKLLESSFDLLQVHESEFTTCFYSTLFSDYPQVQPLFKTTHMDEQARKLFASLVLVVNNLAKPDVLTNALKGLGNRHVKYGVLPEHYPMVGSALLKAMSITLKHEWTAEIEDAWTKAYTSITAIMLEGIDYPKEILIPNNISTDLPS